jgi:large subunit ribosomal protein L15
MAGELSRLSPPSGATHRAKHKGRGLGSGNGKTAGRGHKGQKARKSGGVRAGFEGGSMPLQRRLPKRGFFNHFAKNFAEIRVVHLNRFADGSTVDEAALREAGLVKGRIDGVKVIGNGELNVRVSLKASRISAGARGVIEGAGGSIELIPDRKKWTRPDSRKARRAGTSD